MPMNLLTKRLMPLKLSTTDIREASVQAQEVGVNSCTRFSQGDTFCGYLEKTKSYKKLSGLEVMSYQYLVNQKLGEYMTPGRHSATASPYVLPLIRLLVHPNPNTAMSASSRVI